MKAHPVPRPSKKKKGGVRPMLVPMSEACARLGISERSMFRLRTGGEIGYYQIRGAIKFDVREVEHYKRQHRVGPPLPPDLDLFPLPPADVSPTDLPPENPPTENPSAPPPTSPPDLPTTGPEDHS